MGEALSWHSPRWTTATTHIGEAGEPPDSLRSSFRTDGVAVSETMGETVSPTERVPDHRFL
jgi:hypothetical protein